MEITKNEFEIMYHSLTIKDMAKKLNVTPATIYFYLNKLDIKKKGRGSKKIIIMEG